MKIFDQELTVERLIQYAETEQIWLPEFQRAFVWDSNQIRLLIDSLFHDYTISSILIWDGTDELARRRVGGSIREIKIPDLESSKNIIYLLDGQQRTTTLTLAFTEKPIYAGNNVKKKEVINLFWDSDYIGDDPERRWLFDDEPIFSEDNAGNEVPLCDMKQEEIFRTYGARFIRLKHAYKWNTESQNVLIEMEHNAELFIKYMNGINKIQKDILFRKVYDIEQKGSLENVLEVFERINTKNTKLTIYDIMVAKTYRKVGTNYFDLRNFLLLMNYSGSINADYFKNIEELDLSKTKLILDESNLLAIVVIMLKKEFKINGALKLRTDDLMTNIKFIHDNYSVLIQMLKSLFGIEQVELFKYQPILKFLAAFVSHYSNINLTEQKFIEKWFWNTLIYNRYPGSQNERIAKDFKTVQEYPLEVALQKMKVENSRNLAPIESSKLHAPVYFEAYYNEKNKQMYRAMLLLLKSKHAKDFYNGIEPSQERVSKYKLEEHHIFPQNSAAGKLIKGRYASSKYDELINNIANIALITGETNNKRIKAKNPSIYIIEFEREYSEKGKTIEFVQIMESQFINERALNALRNDDYETFIFERTQELMKQVIILCS